MKQVTKSIMFKEVPEGKRRVKEAQEVSISFKKLQQGMKGARRFLRIY